MRLFSIAIAALSLLGCEKSSKPQPRDARPPLDANEPAKLASHGLILPGSPLFRDAALEHEVARTRSDQPSLVLIIGQRGQAIEVAPLIEYDGGGCYPPIRGTTGLDIHVYADGKSLAQVTTSPTTGEVSGAKLTLGPGAWIVANEVRAEKVSLRASTKAANSFSLAPAPKDGKLFETLVADIPEPLRAMGEKKHVRGINGTGGKTLLRFASSERFDRGLRIRDGCAEVELSPAPKTAGAVAALLGLLGTGATTTIREGSVYFADGTRAGTVAAPIEFRAMGKPPVPGKVCGEFGAREAPGFGSALANLSEEASPADPYWVLCFEPPKED